MATLDQERAAFAWNTINEAERPVDDFKKLALAAPALIMTNGLLQTLAFYKDKSSDRAYLPVMCCILRWTGSRVFGIAHTECDFDNVVGHLLAATPAEYFRATEESLEILKWLRHFAKARGGHQ